MEIRTIFAKHIANVHCSTCHMVGTPKIFVEQINELKNCKSKTQIEESAVQQTVSL